MSETTQRVCRVCTEMTTHALDTTTVSDITIMHQQVKSADEKHFNYVLNEALGRRQSCRERHTKNKATQKTVLCVLTRTAALSSFLLTN